MARKKVIDLDTYTALDAWAISLQEMYKSLRKAGFDEGLALFMITDVQSYPGWILPDPIDPEKFGDYEDDDED